MAHDDFEIAIEQRLRGALDSAGTAALEEHLLGCPAFRDYETRARAEQKAYEEVLRDLQHYVVSK